jgi:hypothetical protein
MPASVNTSATMRWCCPVATTTGRNDGLDRSARITGTSLIASGRVPTMTSTLIRRR